MIKNNRHLLDNLRWLSLRYSPTPHFWRCTPRGLWAPNSNWAEILLQCTYPQVSSSYVYSFGSYRVDRQTNKQTPLKTSNALRYAMTLGNKRVSPSSVTLEFKDFQGPFRGPSYDNHAHSERYSTSSTPLVYMQSFLHCNRIITHTLTE